MRTTLLEAPIPRGQGLNGDPRKMVTALRILGLAARIEEGVLKASVVYGGYGCSLESEKVELVRKIITSLLGLEITKEHTE